MMGNNINVDDVIRGNKTNKWMRLWRAELGNSIICRLGLGMDYQGAEQ